MYQALYRKWRPRTFDELCGQDHITRILRKQCEENRVSHAYLFCGTRGTGKTSMAKILAKAVNCEHPVNGNPCNECYACKAIDGGSATDVLEIDAASNNGVDDIRGLRDEVIYPPSMLKKRVYIIDEVHMLSAGAFNALLKTLEEPPEYIVFILATTELNKLPATIISRCVRFDFTRLSEQVIADRIRYVAKQESIGLDDDAADLLARLADGAMRDGLSILEACNTGLGPENRITAADVEDRIGLAGADQLTAMMRALFQKDIPAALDLVEQIHRSSKDLGVFLDDLSAFARDLLVMTEMKRSRVRSGGRFRYQKEELALLQEFEPLLTAEYLVWFCGSLEETAGRLTRYGTDTKIRLDFMVIRLCDPQLSETSSALLTRIAALERTVSVLRTGAPAAAPAPVKVHEEKPAEPEPEPEQIGFESAPVPEEPRPDAHAEAEAAPMAEPDPEDAFTPFRQLAELREELKSHRDLVPFLNKITAYTRGNTFLIRADGFTIRLLQFGRTPTYLQDALTALTGHTWELLFEAEEEPSTHTLVDEIESDI
ncbi:MAG: DNA polymerase III subunit gamma/tau [Clostridia bacterium]|nr:DNA polymerase III subunit gamma/tau [Clostridia bacterium]